MYGGPLRAEPLAVELHNTIYADRGEPGDGLDRARDWLATLAPRLPAGGGGRLPTAAELAGLRAPVRAALQAAAAGTAPDRAALDALNAAAARAPRSPRAVWRPGGAPAAATDHHGATRAEVVLAAFAADAIALVTRGVELRTCGAPGCVLMFVRAHPRREWCSDACGNRARQARHYARAQKSGSAGSPT